MVRFNKKESNSERKELLSSMNSMNTGNSKQVDNGE